MNSFNIDVNYLLFTLFGMSGGLRFPDVPGASQPNNGITPFGQIPIMPDDVADGTSIIGTPIYMPVSLLEGSYTAYPDKVISYPGYDFDPTTLAVFNRSKNIIKTQVEGNDSTVKELISMGDWNITLTGILFSGTSKYPANQVQAMRNMFEVPAAYKVAGKIFQLLGIHSLVFENINLPQVEAFKGIQPFQITASSDEPIEIQLKKAR